MKKYISPIAELINLGAENDLMLTGSLTGSIITDPSEAVGGGGAMTIEQVAEEESWNYWED